MKRILIITMLVALTPFSVAQGQNNFSNTNPSEVSLIGGLIAVSVSVIIIEAPFLIISSISRSQNDPGKVNVVAKAGNGEATTLLLTSDLVSKTNLRQGDQLTVKRTKTGAILSKQNTPVAYLVSSANSTLSHSNELSH